MSRMVDVSDKPATLRTARAQGVLTCLPETLGRVRDGTAPKPRAVETAELAGVMAAKRTHELIPLCHPLAITNVAVTIEADESLPGFRVAAEVRAHGPTGVEMEALTAVSLACLTLFDMLKGIDRTMTIAAVQVTAKTGGQSGDWAAR